MLFKRVYSLPICKPKKSIVPEPFLLDDVQYPQTVAPESE